jgi:serine/threonine-protein kinase
MAVVWRGVDERLGRQVAVKVLDEGRLADPTAAHRFDREARTVARLTHPNIVAVHDVGRDGEVAYLVMELVDGASLATMLTSGPLDIQLAVTIAAQVCDALAAAHAAGVVHRDIKPGNILLTRTGAVKVCDFGIARLLHAATTQANLTGPATAVGTSEYMAPEQVAGDQVDARTDLYAVGCVLYAMLTGGPPFTGDSPVSVASQHLHRPAPPLRSRRADVPADLDALVGELLAKNPAHRPASAAQVRARLTALSDTDRLAASAAAAVGPSAAWPQGRPPVLPTRALPAVDTDGAHGSAPGRFRLGAVGVAVVAIVAAGLAAVIVAVLLTDRPSGGQAGPPATSTALTTTNAPTNNDTTTNTTTTTPSVATSEPVELITAVQAAIEQQADAGELDLKAAEDLTKKLDDISRYLAEDEADKAADKAADLRAKLSELAEEDKLTAAGLEALTAPVDQLVEVLPPTGG